MRRQRFLSVSLLGLFAAANAVAGSLAEPVSKVVPHIEDLVSPVTVRLRGLSAVDENIAWASGRDGTVIRTMDAGKTWSVFKVPGAEKLDFRDVEGFSAEEAVVLSIGPGEDSRVYRTSDGGSSWSLALQNTNPKAFFDCMDFHGREGRMLGDPVDGHFQVYQSSDAGRTWALMPDGPPAVRDEAAFAASGTCIFRGKDFTAIATGGAASRIVFSPDRLSGKNRWRGIEVPMATHAPSVGVFSLTEWDRNLMAVGGDFQKPDATGLADGFAASSHVIKFHQQPSAPAHMLPTSEGSKLVPEVRGKSWDTVKFEHFANFGGQPLGYRSGVSCLQRPVICIATGPGGTDVLPEDGRTAETWWEVWQMPAAERDANANGIRPITLDDFGFAPHWRQLSVEGYDSVDSTGRVFWLSGDGGRLGRLVLPEQNAETSK